MPDPAPDLLQGNGRAPKPRSVPPEFELILEACRTPEEREAMTRALLMEFEGDPSSVMVQQAVLISRVILQLQKVSLAPANGNGAGQLLSPPAEPAQGIETAGVELKRLTEAVAMLEGHLKGIGEGINKLEIHCGNLDATLGTFAGVKKHQLWQLIAVSMGTGAIIVIGLQLLLDWLRPILHI